MFEEKAKNRLYVGCDHAGFKLKVELVDELKEKGEFDVVDLGCFSEVSCDYPDIAREVAEKVLEVDGAKGILICGTGIGMAMAANRFKGIRAANVYSAHLAEMARLHNNANVLTLGGREIDLDKAVEITEKFLTTDAQSEERHLRRIKKMDSIG